MDSLAIKLVESIQPSHLHPNTLQRFAFFAPSKVEAKIDESIIKKTLEILSNKNLNSTEKDEGIDVEESDYKPLKSYISFIMSTKTNVKSSDRLQVLFKALDNIDNLTLHIKQSFLKLLLILSTVGREQNPQFRPLPLPYSDGTLPFSMFSDKYFDHISPSNDLLFSTPPHLEVSGSNFSMDSGSFSLPSLSDKNSYTNRGPSSKDTHYTYQYSLANFEDISQYNISTAFATTQREANPERFTRKHTKLPDPPQFVTEVPPDVYARYILFQTHKTCLDEAVTVIKHPIPTPHNKLIAYALYTLQGLDSDICSMDRRSVTLIVNEFISSETLSTTPLVNVFKKFAFYGSCYSRLEKLATYLQSGNHSTIGKALGFALSVILEVYLSNVVNLSPPKVMPEDLTLLRLLTHFQVFFETIEGLSKIFKCLSPGDNAWEPYLVSLPAGLDLLVYLEESTEGILPTRPLHKFMCYLLTESNKPLLAYIQNWIFHGQILDPTNEFGLEANQEKLACRSEEFWTKGFSFKENFVVPSFLNGLQDTLLLCGKSLTLMRICDPSLHIINIQPFSELRMKLCPNKLVIKEYRRYWDIYTNETIDYLKTVRQREDEERRFDERDREQTIIKHHEERRRQSKELREKQLKITSEQKQKLMTDLQAQIRDKEESRLQQLKLDKELDEFYAAKTGSILETGVEGSAPGLLEEVKKEIIEKYAVLEREALDKKKLADGRKIDAAVKLGLIEAPTTSDGKIKDGKGLGEVAKEMIVAADVKGEIIDHDYDYDETLQSLDIPQEIREERGKSLEKVIGKEKLGEEVINLEADHKKIERLEKEKSEEEIIPVEKEPVIERTESPIPEDNFYFALEKRTRGSPLFDEDPYRVIPDTSTEEDFAFLEEHESFTAFPVSQLLKLSYSIPVQIQARLVNIFILDYFRNTLQLDNHFTVLRKFVMLENGEFNQSLSLQIFNLLYLPNSEQNSFLWYLNIILDKAIIASRVHNLPQVENLVLGFKEQDAIPMVTSSSLSSEQQQPDQLSKIVLQFNVGWPLNVVFRSFIHSCYTKIFCFLMYVNRSIWCLGSVTGILKSLQERLIRPNSSALKQIKCLHLYRHEMQHFATVLQYYLTNQVLKISWVSFQARLEKVENLEELYIEHRNYVNQIMTNMALNSKGKPIYIAMKRIFFFIYQFFLRLQESHWTSDESSLNNFRGLKEHYDTYKKFAFLLYKLISKLIANGYSSQLESFILSVNFNEHYAQHNPLK